MRTVWQIGSGDAGRDYSWLFLQHDLMFLGPGRYGPYVEATYKTEALKSFSSPRIAAVGSFCEKVQPGDIVLLRRGHRVVAIGIAADTEYEYNTAFDDIYGWDLQHTRRVIWQEDLAAELKKIQPDAKGELFGARKQIPTFTRANDPKIIDSIEHLFEQCTKRPLKPLPDALPEPLTLEQLGEQLFQQGLANSAVEQVQRAIERQRRLLRWYEQHGEESHRPTEHEVVAHMALPLLLALGWSEQLLAVEWRKVDMAGFSGTPTMAEHCVLVCEAKGIGHGMQKDFEQAGNYVDNLHLNNCRKILLTQGGRFYLYRRIANETWEEKPSGYFNVERIRTTHIAPAGANAVETLMALTPARIHH